MYRCCVRLCTLRPVNCCLSQRWLKNTSPKTASQDPQPSTSTKSAQVSLTATDLMYLAKNRPKKKKILIENINGFSPEWSLAEGSYSRLPSIYAQLSKARLTGLVTVTALAGFALGPSPFVFESLLACGLGTALMSSCANTFNQFLEVPYDSQMKRTQARALVVGKISPAHAISFGLTCGLVGFGTLWTFCNPLTASFGLANVILYAGIYTPLKRHSIACTWAGALVGAIPPLMGWAANCNGLDPAVAVLGAILFCWQFPHFNSLSWNLRPEYSKGGYRVMCVTNPDLCLRTTIRYSIALIGLCSIGAPLTDLTSWWFSFGSLPLNGYLTYLSYKFYEKPDSKNSRELFRYTLMYLPALMAIMIVCNLTRKRKNNEN